jgi:mono/diheme cytochrome c family protein
VLNEVRTIRELKVEAARRGYPVEIRGVITYQNGRSGNFFIQGGPPLKAPYTAKLSDGAKTRAMVGKVTSGDCNSCHTKDGLNGAPGRILVP